MAADNHRNPDGIAAVAVGASAGGVEAVCMLLAALPRSFKPALLTVIHIPSGIDSLLIDVLQPRCALAVREAQDKEEIESGTVYVAPPGYHLLVEPDRTLALSADEPVNFCRPSIDVLFESAAYAYGTELLAIVLTGANDDGADGLTVVRASGGRAWVQEPATAVAPTMPAAALGRAGADRILTLEEVAAELAAMT